MIIFVLLYFCFAGLAWWMAAFLSREIQRTRHWQTVMGSILERGVGEPMKSISFGYVPNVYYSYTVAGREYKNNQVYLHKQTGNLDWQIRKLLVNGLPNPVPVHYDPQHPENSYLIANPKSTIWILVVFGILAFVVGLMLLL
jgi:Protein of unknown function (DUF3592)